MRYTNLIERVLEAHEVNVQITGPWGEATRLKIAMPDLRSAPREVHGDWGPMYTVTMPADCAVDLSIETLNSPLGTPQTLGVRRLEFASPMNRATRRETPLMARLPLSQQGVTLRVYYDTDGHPAKADLVPMGVTNKSYDSYDVCISTNERASADVLDWGRAARAAS